MYDELERAVAAQRLAGASWSAVAQVLGVTKSAAHKRWAYVDRQRKRKGVAVMSDGSYVDVATQAVVSPAQMEQVRRHGRIIEHHERNGITS